MKKFLSLMMLLMATLVSVDAQTTLYSWESPEGTVSESGGTIEFTNGIVNDTKPSRLNYQNGNYYTICLNGKKANIDDTTASDNAGHMVLTLDEALEEGDEINITAYINKSSSTTASAYIRIGSTAIEGAEYGDAANIGLATPGVITTTTSEVPAGAAGSKVIKLTRSKSGTNLFITKLTVTRPDKSAPKLEVDNNSLTFTLVPIALSASKTFKLTGVNLTDGEYSLTTPNLSGLNVTPASFTVSGGTVEQEFTVTYTSDESVEQNTATITATVGEVSASVGITYSCNATSYTQTQVSEATTWDWTKLTSTLELSASTQPKNTDEFLLANADGLITFTDGFPVGRAQEILITGQFPSRAGYTQNSTVKFNTIVPGTIEVEFSNTGGSNKDRFVHVTDANGAKTGTVEADGTTKRTESFDVAAGDVAITGVAGTEGGTTAIRIYKITFTPTAAALTVSDAITDGEYFYTTFSSDKALDFSEVEGVTAYVGVKNIAGWDSYLELTEVQQIPANTGVIIKAAEAKEYTIPFAEGEVEAPEANDILAAVTTVNSSTVTNGYLIGGYESSFMGEFLYFRSIGSVATDIPAGTAYLSLTNDEEEIAYGTVYVKFPAGPATDVANVAALKEATDEVVKLTLDSENGTLLTCIGAGDTDYYYTLEDATGATLVTGPADLSTYGGYKFTGAITLEIGYGVYKISDFSEMTIASFEQAEPSAIANVEDDFEWRYIEVTGGKYNAETQSLYISEFADNFGMMDITSAFSNFPADGSTVNAIGYIYDGAPIGGEGYYFQPVSIEVTVPVTVSSVGYATFSSDKNLDFTNSDIKAYTATITGNQVNFTRIYQVPAGTGVLLWAAGGATEYIPVIASAPTVSENAFKVAQYDMNKSNLNEGGQAYVLGNGDYGIGFYQPAEGFTLPAGKCYLQIWEGEARIFLPGMEATGIGATLVKNEGVKNEIFNLNGQRINKLQKGLNIVNGKKVIVK